MQTVIQVCDFFLEASDVCSDRLGVSRDVRASRRRLTTDIPCRIHPIDVSGQGVSRMIVGLWSRAGAAEDIGCICITASEKSS
ncbi:hypothetical protein NDU88_006532 [Pleurodeles waltl]|uniref:Uncharacterized protein n=1 Tax=Pleurodeles waltl TaxID=8319 RepID=A0AAV7MG04_PLEWA|nr:hypothetical protein NDU88_006532 [Pleurodeles waltl]